MRAQEEATQCGSSGQPAVGSEGENGFQPRLPSLTEASSPLPDKNPRGWVREDPRALERAVQRGGVFETEDADQEGGWGRVCPEAGLQAEGCTDARRLCVSPKASGLLALHRPQPKPRRWPRRAPWAKLCVIQTQFPFPLWRLRRTASQLVLETHFSCISQLAGHFFINL